MDSHSINASSSYEDGHLVMRTQAGTPLITLKLDPAWGTPSGRIDIDAIDLKRDPWLASLWAYVEGPKVTRAQTGEHLQAVTERLWEVGRCSEAGLDAWAKALRLTDGEMQRLYAMLVRELEEVHRTLRSTLDP